MYQIDDEFFIEKEDLELLTYFTLLILKILNENRKYI